MLAILMVFNLSGLIKSRYFLLKTEVKIKFFLQYSKVPNVIFCNFDFL